MGRADMEKEPKATTPPEGAKKVTFTVSRSSKEKSQFTYSLFVEQQLFASQDFRLLPGKTAMISFYLTLKKEEENPT